MRQNHNHTAQLGGAQSRVIRRISSQTLSAIKKLNTNSTRFYTDTALNFGLYEKNYDINWLIEAQRMHDLFINHEKEKKLNEGMLNFYKNVRVELKKDIIDVITKAPEAPAESHEKSWHDAHYQAYVKSGFPKLYEDDLINLVQVIGPKKLLTIYPWTMVVKSAGSWIAEQGRRMPDSGNSHDYMD